MPTVAGTLGRMKERIANEIARSNLATQIGYAISDAISEYQKERFRFSDVDPAAPPTFNTVADRYIYDSNDNANISSLYNFDYVQVEIGASVDTLERWDPGELTQYLQVNTMRGQPSWYAYEGNKLLIAPIPNTAYPITLGVFRRVAEPASDDETGNPWMVEAELLIRSRAKYELATHVTRNIAMQEAMSPNPPPAGKSTGHATWRAWRSLKGEANRVTSLGRVRPMAF